MTRGREGEPNALSAGWLVGMQRSGSSSATSITHKGMVFDAMAKAAEMAVGPLPIT